jgi:hypothetical protein
MSRSANIEKMLVRNGIEVIASTAYQYDAGTARTMVTTMATRAASMVVSPSTASASSTVCVERVTAKIARA